MKIKYLFEKENILPISFSIAITGLFFITYFYLGNRLLSILGITTGILLVILLSLVMFVTSLMVLEALFFVAAEISLLIFLAQSYCAVPHNTAGNEALESLLVLGFAYILVTFFRKFYEIVKGKYFTIVKERWSKEKIIVVTLFLTFSILLMLQVYQVVNPIVRDLCIYK